MVCKPTPEETLPTKTGEQGQKENKVQKGRARIGPGAIKQPWKWRHLSHKGCWILEHPHRGLGISVLQDFPNSKAEGLHQPYWTLKSAQLWLGGWTRWTPGIYSTQNYPDSKIKSRNRAPLASRGPRKGRGSHDCDWKTVSLQQWCHLPSWPMNCQTQSSFSQDHSHNTPDQATLFPHIFWSTFPCLCPLQPRPFLLHSRNTAGIILPSIRRHEASLPTAGGLEQGDL